MDCLILNGDYCRVRNFDIVLKENVTSNFLIEYIINDISHISEDAISYYEEYYFAEFYPKDNSTIVDIMQREEAGAVLILSSHPQYKELYELTLGRGEKSISHHWADYCDNCKSLKECPSKRVNEILDNVRPVYLPTENNRVYNFEQLQRIDKIYRSIIDKKNWPLIADMVGI